MPESAGDLVTPDGEVVGAHQGIHHFTVGQKKGVQQRLHSHHATPFYVLGIEPAKNRVVVGEESLLHTRSATADRLNWISVAELREPMRVLAKIRHRHEPAPATIRPLGDSQVQIDFDEPQRAVTPGQAAIFFSGEDVVGGGWLR